MTSTAYDIRAAVREVLAETDLTDPGDIAVKVAENVPAKALRSVLMVVLRDFVRHEFHHMPRTPSPEPGYARSPKLSRSAKVSAIRAWAMILRKPVAVEGNNWIRFGDCTVDDLTYLALDRRRNAAESVSAAERFEKYAAAVAEHGVTRVVELSDEVIASIEDGDQ